MPSSLWLAEPDGAAPATAPRLPAATDVVVVGGGVIGIATAYWLARLGMDVLVLESRRLGSGASGRNAGLMLAGSSALEDPATLRVVLAEERIAAEYEQPGHLTLATSPDVLERIRDEAAGRPVAAPRLALLDREACEDLLGLRIGPHFLGGRWLPSGGALHPIRFLRGLAAAAQRHGAVVVERTSAQAVGADGEHAGVAVVTRRGTVRARHVVVACGARTGRLVPAPLRRALAPSRGQMLATAPLRRLFRVGLAVDWGAVYCRQLRTGEIVVGGCRASDPASERTAWERVNPRIQTALTAFLPAAFPDVAAPAVRWRWAGIMDETPDGAPLVGPCPDAPGQWVAAGLGGHGLPPALGIGRALATAIREGSGASLPGRMDPARLIGAVAA